MPAVGHFDLRIFDARGIANWGTFDWTADVPANTSLVVRVRTGDTYIPDASSWTAWSDPLARGTDITANSRYLQYRLELQSADAGLTPVVSEVWIGYDATPDATPPHITARVPAPSATTVPLDIAVTATFDEPLDPATVTASSFRLRRVGSASDVLATVSYAGLTATLRPSTPLLPSQQYQVTVAASVADLSGNPLGSDDIWTFTTAARPWLDPAWHYRRAVQVSCPCSQDAGEYQVQIVLTNANFSFDNANANGSDLPRHRCRWPDADPLLDRELGFGCPSGQRVG